MGDSLAHWLKIYLSTANIRSGLVLNLEFKEEVESEFFLLGPRISSTLREHPKFPWISLWNRIVSMLAYQDFGGRISCLQRICLDSPGNSDSEEHTREAETMSEDRIPDSLGETDYSHSKSPHTPCRDSQIFTTPTTVSSAFQKERPVINISHSLHPLPPTDWFHLQCWWIQYQPRNRTGCVETVSSHVIHEPGRAIFRCSGCHH